QGGFTREAAEEITGAGFQDLASLVGKSLLQYKNSENRYYVHELLRQYGAEKLSLDDEAEEQLRDRHSHYYLHWLQAQFDPGIRRDTGRKAETEMLKIELENARAAWMWSLRDVDRGPTITRKQLMRIGKLFISRVGYLEGDRAFRNIADQLAGVDETSEVNSIVLKAGTLIWQAVFEAELGDRNVALQLLRESKSLLDSPRLADLDLLEERAHYLVNYTRADRTQPYEARLEQLDKAAEMYRQAGEPFGLAFALTNSAFLAIVTGRLEEAGQLLEESVLVQEQSESLLGLAVSYTELGILSFVKNDYEEAKGWLRKSVDISYELENLHRVTAGSIYLGTVHIYSGEFNRAREILKKCVADSADLGIKPRHATALNYLGYSEMHLGNYRAADELGRTALDLARETDTIEITAQAIMLIGATALARENYPTALERFKEADSARAIRPIIEIVNGEDPGRIGLAAALLQQDRVREAEAIITSLWERAREDQRLDQLLQALVSRALLASVRGRNQKATELYAVAAGLPFVGNSRWFHDAFGRYILPEGGSISAPYGESSSTPTTFQEIWSAAEKLVAAG
ncbi:MAG: hypothetical protein R3335_02785, partial [Anaerolineales bacterium]|nr:hypothetical protein [Anaerolineales bacterium]